MTAFFRGLSEAMGELWQDLMRGEGGWKGLRMGLVVLLLLGILQSAYVFHGMIAQMALSATMTPPRTDSLEEERARLDQLAESFRIAVEARVGSGQLARMAALNGRRPYGPLSVARAPELASSFIPVKVPPPLIIVSAVMEMGDKKMAVAEIEGMGPGLIISAGFKLDGGRGRILSISSERVVFVWEGDRYDIPVGY